MAHRRQEKVVTRQAACATRPIKKGANKKLAGICIPRSAKQLRIAEKNIELKNMWTFIIFLKKIGENPEKRPGRCARCPSHDYM